MVMAFLLSIPRAATPSFHVMRYHYQSEKDRFAATKSHSPDFRARQFSLSYEREATQAGDAMPEAFTLCAALVDEVEQVGWIAGKVSSVPVAEEPSALQRAKEHDFAAGLSPFCSSPIAHVLHPALAVQDMRVVPRLFENASAPGRGCIFRGPPRPVAWRWRFFFGDDVAPFPDLHVAVESHGVISSPLRYFESGSNLKIPQSNASTFPRPSGQTERHFPRLYKSCSIHLAHICPA